MKISQRFSGNLHEDTVHLWLYLAQFFLKSEMFRTNVVEKSKTYILCSINFSPKITPFMR